MAPREDEGAAGRPAEPQPEWLGEYRVLAELGRGGMGIVYEAEQPVLGRRVALKVLDRHGTRRRSAVERFLREARAVARLHHTNIVSVHGVIEAADRPCLVMELVEGRGLDEVIAEARFLRAAAGDEDGEGDEGARRGGADELSQTIARGVLVGPWESATRSAPDATETAAGDPVPRVEDAGSGPAPAGSPPPGAKPSARAVAAIGLQVAEALAHAHSRGVLHRDVKPSNILVDEELRVWVTDFGVAKLDEDGEDLTRAGDVVGTLRYMAPERLRGRCDAGTDIYGLGLTLHELLTLRPGVGRPGVPPTLEEVARGVVRPLGAAPWDVPRDLASVVSKAAAADPAERYESAAALADDLRRYLEGRPVTARRHGPGERAWRWCRRNPALAGLGSAAAALLLALAVGSTVAAVQFRGANRQTKRALFDSLVEKARALRLTSEAGRGAAARESVARAAALLPDIEADETDVLALRNEVIASLALIDLQPLEVPLPELGTGQVGLERGLGRSARVTDDGRVVVSSLAGVEVSLPMHGGNRHDKPPLFSADGRYLAAMGSLDNTLRGLANVWDLETGQAIVTPGAGTQWDVDLSIAAGQAAVAEHGVGIRLHDLRDGARVGMLETAFTPARVRYSADGELLATCELDSPRVVVWNVASRDRVASLGEERRVSYQRCALAWHPTEPILAASQGGRVGVWRVDEGHEITQLPRHVAAVTELDFSASGDLLASSSWSFGGHLWSTDTWDEVVSFANARVQRFEGSDRLVVDRARPAGVALLEVERGGVLRRLEGRRLRTWLSLVGFTTDERSLIVTTSRGIMLCDARTGDVLDEVAVPGVRSLEILRQEGLLLGMRGADLAWIPLHETGVAGETRFGEPWFEPLGLGRLRSVDLAPDGARLVVLDQDHDIHVFGSDRRAGPSWSAAHDIATGAGFDPSSRWVVTSTHSFKERTGKERVHVFDASTGDLVAELGPGRWARPHFSPAGDVLATASARDVRFWRVGTWELLREVPATGGGNTPPWATFSPDGSVLVMGAHAEGARIVDVATGRTVASLKSSRRPASMLRFTPSGGRLAVQQGQSGAHVWELGLLRDRLRALGVDWDE